MLKKITFWHIEKQNILIAKLTFQMIFIREAQIMSHGDTYGFKQKLLGERTPSQEWKTPELDDFRRSALGTTKIIQLGHMIACLKGQSLNYVT